MLLAALLLLQAAPQCAALDTALASNLSGWTAPGAGFGINKAVTLAVDDLSKLAGIPAGTRPGGAVLIGFKVQTAGRYSVALDQRGWIDVLPGLSGGEALKSVAHGHGPECSTIRKIVRFDLQPGVHRLYVTGLDKPVAKVMLVAD
jgi:flagellar basal body rod protein FlgF